MRILVTGYTTLQCGSQNRPIQKIDVPQCIVDELRRQGHEVTWADVPAGDLEWCQQFDGAVVCIAVCNSPASFKALNAMWFLSTGIPSVIMWDDWQMTAAVNGHRAVAKHRDKQLNKTIGGSRLYHSTPEERLTPEVRAALFHVAETVAERRHLPHWKANIMPMYRWGDPTTSQPYIFRDLPTLTVDHSGHVPLLDEPLPEHREREWFLASLMPHDEWVETKVKPSWPVVYAGSRKLIRTGKAKDRFKTELDVQRRMSESWGALCPAYKNSGVGRWRSRFLYAAHLRNVLYCEQADGLLLGPSYLQPIHAIENQEWGNNYLRDLAEDQAYSFFSKVGNKNSFTREVQDIVDTLAKG